MCVSVGVVLAPAVLQKFGGIRFTGLSSACSKWTTESGVELLAISTDGIP